MLTWSSWPADEGIESTAAGWARDLLSETSEAAVYCTIMNPELSPGRSTRNAGSPLLEFGSRSRYSRRSEIEATPTVAPARASRATATGWPWKFPPETTSPSSKTMGLSDTEPISVSMTRAVNPSTSRKAPWTWGAQRNE